ncbi:sulfurtransferase complex subunit TusB [Pseudomonas sp. 21LCFQ02]|uniref:sulfurtransferase complex subunit TusB n=1 Tax=unclassified Pseudomonas TaxID=196821 RepID=UPI0004F61114|nr:MULTISPECIES: sulfurtransferase complex subunit TusB [unclassified Pseudomonas]MCO8165421.1 sulfurtransferase complex subunit TusB [Pseudomonas sp. 21LCFQ010]MCO8169074.1 sulfurtransferase complex subunit TusB [Pseudomonas sp. 21LCFQ02]MCQ9422080.1 sulfurtransferase complex subunit TusB [Pseudomonas sp. LJDD11]BAP46099.1 dsrH family protein [Pseudomonas sp. StFLB209]
MATLHVVSHSPFADSRLSSCLRVLGEHDALLLCGDATYALRQPDAALSALGERLFALEEDLLARHLALPASARAVDYPGFVELSVRFDKVNTWL